MEQVKAVVISILLVVGLITILVVGVNSVKSYKCTSIGEVMSVASEYSWSTGCMITDNKGNKVPLLLQRYAN